MRDWATREKVTPKDLAPKHVSPVAEWICWGGELSRTVNIMKTSHLAVFGLALASASTAHAGVLNITSMVPGKFQIVSANLFGNNETFYSGPQNAQYNGGSFFDGYCTDFGYTNNLPVAYAATPTSALTLSNGARVAKLYNTFASTVSSADAGAALQLAIWDVIYDNGDGAASGNFKVTGGLTAGISSYLTSFLSDPLSGASTDVTYYAADNHGPNNNLYQGIIGPGAGQPVPEPASMAVLGLGALFLRRRNKKA